jgi:phage gpG-like protein
VSPLERGDKRGVQTKQMADFYYKGKPYNFSSIQPRIEAARNRLPVIMGNTALNFFKQSFIRQGFLNKGLTKWPARKSIDKGRSLLVKTSRLWNSIRLMVQSFSDTTIGTDVPYAAVHNWGFRGTVMVPEHSRRRNAVSSAKFSSLKTRRTGSKEVKYEVGKSTVKAHTRNMNIPQRQFMGNSDELEEELMGMVDAEVSRIFD